MRFMLYSALVWGIGIIRRTDGRGGFLGDCGRFRLVSFRFGCDCDFFGEVGMEG